MDNQTISKSDFLKFNECSSYFWFWKNRKEVLTEKELDPFVQRLSEQGQEVESKVRELFPEGVMVNTFQEEAVADTQRLIEQGAKTIFQASFIHDGLYIMCDVLIWNDLFKAWDLIEVKSSSTTDQSRKKSHHIIDATFQKIVLDASGHKVVNVYLIELNKEFIKVGELDLKKLFIESEVTTEVLNKEPEVLADINHAKNILRAEQPTKCDCSYKGRSKHCAAFNYMYPRIPEYSIYDFRSIGSSKKKLTKLVDEGIFDFKDVREDHELTVTHRKQLRAEVNNEVILEKEIIQEELNALTFPIYFLDYETLPMAIPVYDGTYPYQQVVIQYSLHILYKDGKIEHKEYIHRDKTSPQKVMAEKLRADIGDEGSVIVWNKGFEATCNKDLANANPELADFILKVNNRIYDIMDIIKKQKYVHKDFRGKYSIKSVLPVMCPELNYSNLAVSNGTEAVTVYEHLIFGNYPPEEKEQAFQNLLEYCKLDTWAMVRIYQELLILIQK